MTDNAKSTNESVCESSSSCLCTVQATLNLTSPACLSSLLCRCPFSGAFFYFWGGSLTHQQSLFKHLSKCLALSWALCLVEVPQMTFVMTGYPKWGACVFLCCTLAIVLQKIFKWGAAIGRICLVDRGQVQWEASFRDYADVVLLHKRWGLGPGKFEWGCVKRYRRKEHLSLRCSSLSCPHRRDSAAFTCRSVSAPG